MCVILVIIEFILSLFLYFCCKNVYDEILLFLICSFVFVDCLWQ